MKNFVIFKGNMEKSDIIHKIEFTEICNLWGFDLQKHLPRKTFFWKALERLVSN